MIPARGPRSLWSFAPGRRRPWKAGRASQNPEGRRHPAKCPAAPQGPAVRQPLQGGTGSPGSPKLRCDHRHPGPQTAARKHANRRPRGPSRPVQELARHAPGTPPVRPSSPVNGNMLCPPRPCSRWAPEPSLSRTRSSRGRRLSLSPEVSRRRDPRSPLRTGTCSPRGPASSASPRPAAGQVQAQRHAAA